MMMFFQPHHENRYRIVRLGYSSVVDAFNWQVHAAIAMPVIEKLPDGYEVVAVNHEHLRRCFALTVYHPSFSQVPDGQEIPEFDSKPLMVKLVELRRIDKDAEGPVIVEVLT